MNIRNNTHIASYLREAVDILFETMASMTWYMV
jgi:hypothetical protein